MGCARGFATVECLSGCQRTWEWTVSVREMWNEVVQKNDSGGTVSVCEMENTFSRENDSVRGKVLPHIGGHGGLVVGLHHGDDPRSRCDQRVLSVHVPRR